MEKEIGKLKKNETTDVVIRLDDFGGRPGVTIREFVTSERYTGFTKSGVKIPASDFRKFKEIVNSIADEDLKSISGVSEELQADAQKTLDEKEIEDY
jgi:hypothetical protein